jgi:hypothetical protein
MSTLTYWLAIIAAVFCALFLLNSVVCRIRFGTFLTSRSRSPGFLRSAMSAREVAIALLPVVGMVAGLAAPVFVPETSFARWLAQPYSQIVYFVWCFLAGMIVGVTAAVLKYFVDRRS